MQILRRRISNWWLLLIPPALLLASPALLKLFFMGNNLAGAVFGPPAIWNRPWHTPRRSDLPGRYLGPERHLDHESTLSSSSLTLNPDGSMIVAGLPAEFGEASCTLSGTGNWTGPDEDQKIDLILISKGSFGTCEAGLYSSLQLAGYFKPYSLYWIIGDPDSGIGIWLKRN
jgi:hypothetical protein